MAVSELPCAVNEFTRAHSEESMRGCLIFPSLAETTSIPLGRPFDTAVQFTDGEWTRQQHQKGIFIIFLSRIFTSVPFLGCHSLNLVPLLDSVPAQLGVVTHHTISSTLQPSTNEGSITACTKLAAHCVCLGRSLDVGTVQSQPPNETDPNRCCDRTSRQE